MNHRPQYEPRAVQATFRQAPFPDTTPGELDIELDLELPAKFVGWARLKTGAAHRIEVTAMLANAQRALTVEAIETFGALFVSVSAARLA